MLMLPTKANPPSTIASLRWCRAAQARTAQFVPMKVLAEHGDVDALPGASSHHLCLMWLTDPKPSQPRALPNSRATARAISLGDAARPVASSARCRFQLHRVARINGPFQRRTGTALQQPHGCRDGTASRQHQIYARRRLIRTIPAHRDRDGPERSGTRKPRT